MFKRGKRAQFYLIATMVILVAITQISITLNNLERIKNPQIEFMKEQMIIEGQKTIDRALIKNLDIEEDLEIFFINYAEYFGKGTEIYAITGKSGNIKITKYSTNLKNIIPSTEIGNKLKFNLYETEYWFDILEGENFYFMIFQERGDERYIIRG